MKCAVCAVRRERDMSIEASDFPSRLRAHVELQGANLTEDELSHLGAHYPRCAGTGQDRKSTRLNSIHSQISYAVFCLKKKNEQVYMALVALSSAAFAKHVTVL